jgi:hypothetical protein
MADRPRLSCFVTTQVLPLRLCSPAAILEDFVRNHLAGQNDQGGNNQDIVQISENRNKIGDQVNGRDRIADREPEQPFRKLGSPRIRDNEAIKRELSPEGLTYPFELCEHL